MEDLNQNEILAIDEDLEQKLLEDEARNLKPIQKKFITSYLNNKDKEDIEKWLYNEMAESLPEYSESEVKKMSEEIINTIKIQEEKKKSLEEAVRNGRSKESWFASEMSELTSLMGAHKASEYLNDLDKAIKEANESLYRTLHTQSGIGPISQNPHLDGFIAEQYHAQTFNLNAEATGSQYRAKVLEPIGKGYSKNSVDIVIVDGAGKVVKRYQSKYYKNAEETAKAFRNGDYRGQQKLVPDGQHVDIKEKTTTVLRAPDGTESNPLTKKHAKELQNEAQNGEWNDLNWNEYKAKDLAIGIGKQAGQAALMGMAVGIGFDIAQKVWNDEKIDGEELIETAIKSGADFGIKAATAGAIKVGVEKGIISAIPKGTPAGIIANMVHVGVENAKIIGKVVIGELTAKEAYEKMEQVTVSTISGIAAAGKGATIGAVAGSVFGPVGTVVGGFAGGTIGYMAGAKLGEKIVKGVQVVRDKAKEVIAPIKEKVKEKVREFGERFLDRLLYW